MSDLTDEQKRIRIHEALGFVECESCKANGYPGKWRNLEDTGCDKGIPDYLNSLDAMAEARKSLSRSQFRIYVVKLTEVVSPYKGEWESVILAKVINATAAQHAEAFLRTIGEQP